MAQTPTLTLEVADPTAVARFYQALGFTEAVREPDRVELERGALRLSILAGGAAGHGTGAVTGAQLTVHCDDADATKRALLEAGGVVPGDYSSGWSGAVVLDPAGNAVRLLSPVAVPVPAATPNTASAAAPLAPPTAPPVGRDNSGTGMPGPQPTDEGGSGPQTLTTAGGSADAGLPQSSLPASYYTNAGVPTFDAVAERIHRETAIADGNEILDAESQRGRDEADAMEKLKQAGKDRLEQLRKSFGA